MAYGLFTRTYDVTLRFSDVVISNKWTGVPALIMAGPSGGVLNDKGTAALDVNAQLNVYIDLDQEWTVKIMDSGVLEYNILDPKKIVSISELRTLVPRTGVTYVLNQAPYSEYVWDGVNLVSSLNSSETSLVQVLSDVQLSNIVTDVGGRITSYTLNGSVHTIDYSTPNVYMFSNDTGTSKMVTVDNDGNVISIT
jgi:hypothetical protein